MECKENVVNAIKNSIFKEEEKIIFLIHWLDLEDDFDLDEIEEDGCNFIIDGDEYLILTNSELTDEVDSVNESLIEGLDIPRKLKAYFDKESYLADFGDDKYTLYHNINQDIIEIDDVEYKFNIVQCW